MFAGSGAAWNEPLGEIVGGGAGQGPVKKLEPELRATPQWGPVLISRANYLIIKKDKSIMAGPVP
jgi:hypothetical protein